MAKGAYIGVNNVARKIKKGYIGVDGKARKIKKAYIGIGGVARPCWSSGEVEYYGTLATGLSEGKYLHSGASNSKYAVFAGGYNGVPNTGYLSTVDAFDKNLTKATPTNLGKGRFAMAVTTISDKVLFGDGEGGDYTVDAYDASLIRTNPTNFSRRRSYYAAATNANYAIFYGDIGNSTSGKTADVYNTNFTKTDIGVSKWQGGNSAAYNGAYAIFANGFGVVGGSGASGTATSFSETLTNSNNISGLTSATNRTALRFGDYAVFAGGANGSKHISNVYAYDQNCTLTNVTALSQASVSFGTVLKNNAIFANYTGTDIYNTDFTRKTVQAISQAGAAVLAQASIGDYALYTGGLKDGAYLTTVSAFCI